MYSRWFYTFYTQATRKNQRLRYVFYHDFSSNTFALDEIKYSRRILRLQNTLQNANEPIVFIRKGHSCHHHNEHSGRFLTIKSDIDDSEDLDKNLSEKYPNLLYTIIVILVCGKCFDSKEKYKSVSERINIYNIASMVIDNPKFDECFHTIAMHKLP